MSDNAWLEDALRDGVTLGDRDALWSRVKALEANDLLSALNEPCWPPPDAIKGDAADEVVRGMFEMVANHLRSADAQKAFAPLNLLILLRGDTTNVNAFVISLDDASSTQRHYLMVLRPAVFIDVADRLLRALTCAEVWPELGDLCTCQQTWLPTPLANQPQDIERFQLAMNMAMLAALVTLYHEMAHILRGHSAYWATQAEANEDAGLGMAAIREYLPLAMAQGMPFDNNCQSPDLTQRAMELDADIHAGLFLASTLKLGALGDIAADDLPYWCELLAFVATVTFNTFEAHAQREDYKNGYHLPSTRTECFLEGAARGLEIKDPSWFASGADAGFKFCAEHYKAPATLAEIEADIAELEQHTQPFLRELQQAFSKHVPEAWRK